MILSVHMLIGAAIGSYLQSEIIASPGGKSDKRPACGATKVKSYLAIFLSSILAHFLLDLLPHWEYLSTAQATDSSGAGIWLMTVRALADIAIGGAIILWLLWRRPQLTGALWGAFFALWPDGLMFLYTLLPFFFQWTPPFIQGFYGFHHFLHFKERNGILFWEIAWEALFFLLPFFFLYWQTRKRPVFLQPLFAKVKINL